MSEGIVLGEDGRSRCWWPGADALYVQYHDQEWGRPVVDEARLFEKLVLEGFQSGLSWLTILRKRENFRRAFADFDIARVARFGAQDVERLMGDAGIVRHRGKIEAAISNANAAQQLVAAQGSLARYIWTFEPSASERPGRLDHATLRGLSQTVASKRLSKDLKSRGFRFVGPTTAYAFMQAMGLVNDHLQGCFVRAEVERKRAAFKVPR